MLNDLLMFLFALLVVAIISGLVVIGIWVLSIWYTATRTEKAPMFYCDRHGMMLESDTIKFMDSAEIVDELGPNNQIKKSHIEHGIRYCPRCFSEKLGGPLQ